jgi:hypothetical protein
MSLETATYINQLDAANPLGSDPIASGDDHLRLIKSTLKNTFPNITGVITKTHTEINNLASLTDLSSLETAVATAIVNAMNSTKDALYPVGSIYTNATNATNPATLLGFGTWSAFGAGRVPVGYDSTNTNFNAAEKTGGSANAIVVSHSHSVSVTDPGHTHAFTVIAYNTDSSGSGALTGGSNNYNNDGSFSGTTASATTGISATAVATGSSGTDANLQPYITVYMWKRTA